MSTRKSKRNHNPIPASESERPGKPYPDFPLYAHQHGFWAKKIRGKTHYFGRWGRVVDGRVERDKENDGSTDALDKFNLQKDDLYAGRTPRVAGDQRITVGDLCNKFLIAKLRKLQAGELSKRMFAEYKETTDLLVSSFGKDRLVDDLAADDFGKLRAAMADKWGPVRLGNAIVRVKSVFKFGTDPENGLIEKAVRFGSEFKKPAKSVLRKHRAQAGEKMLEPDQLRLLLDVASVSLRAMMLLGLNCGFGNADCGNLPLTAIDLDRGWIDYPRPKTGIDRRCPLWPETVAALREAIAVRPKPKEASLAGLVFLTSRGMSCVSGGLANAVGAPFAKLLKAHGLHRAGVGFYTLRHVFRTIADAARDPVAIDLIMGHSDPSMGAHYRERIEDSRLVAVTEHVRAWLFAPPIGG
jgi:integrase